MDNNDSSLNAAITTNASNLPMVPSPATVVAAPPSTAGLSEIQTVVGVERSVKERRDVDVPLTNWWLASLVIEPFTLGIYYIVIYFKRIGRIDKFTARKQRYYEAVLSFTERYAATMGSVNQVQGQIDDTKSLVAHAFSGRVRPIKAGLSFLLSLITLGIYGFIVWYRMNRAWDDLQKLEQEFDDKLSQIWLSLSLVKYPIKFEIDTSKKRSYGLYLFLSIITLGIWGLVWDYKVHTDPDNLYKEFHGVEDTVLQTIRAV
jgi:nitrate reductase NapE component